MKLRKLLDSNKAWFVMGFVLALAILIGLRERAAEVVVDEAPDTATEAAVNDPLLYVFAGPTWIWQETRLNNGEVLMPALPGAFTISFSSSDGAVIGTTDCNSFRGAYTAGAGRGLALGPLASTKMFCENSQETEFVTLVASSSRYFFTAEGDLVLVLAGESGLNIFKRKQ